MIKEFIIFIYLLMVRLLSGLFRLFPVNKKKIVILAAFPENNLFILKALLEEHVENEIVLVCTRNISNEFASINIPIKYKVKTLDRIHPIIIYHLMTASKIIVDNYIGFLSAIRFKTETECIQIWHANGALKKFGFADHSAKTRNKASQQRFQSVYNNFQKIVVGSDAMGEIFHQAFETPKDRLLKIGMPRTDLFFDEELRRDIYEIIGESLPVNSRKIILYAPTFRDQELHQFNLQLQLETMYEHLSEDYILIIKLHPAIQKSLNFEALYPGFIYDFSGYKRMNDLLLITDILITDYSSIPFEFAILQKPMIFYAYDLEQYTKERGLWENYSDFVPGPVVKSTEELIHIIQTEDFDYNKLKEFNLKWNQYNNGRSSENLVHYILNNESEIVALRKTL